MNHLGDTNKMVETPRTDAEYERLFEIYQNAERINGPLCCAFENDMRLCGQLERELNAANDRIKRLEEMYEGVIGEQPELLGSNVMGLLKRELNAAQKRIKRLEEAGVELRECASWVGHSCCQYADQILRAKAAIEAWDKESKP